MPETSLPLGFLIIIAQEIMGDNAMNYGFFTTMKNIVFCANISMTNVCIRLVYIGLGEQIFVEKE